jgi:hypothetical protein
MAESARRDDASRGVIGRPSQTQMADAGLAEYLPNMAICPDPPSLYYRSGLSN